MTSPTTTTSPAAAPPPVAQARLRILLVDDEPDYPQLVLIPELGDQYDVFYVRSAIEALAALKSQSRPFALVILDLMLDERMPRELAQSADLVSEALRRRGLSTQYSAQALGLWLWQHRVSHPQRYCYLSSYPAAHVPNLALVAGNPEFDGADAAAMRTLVCQRGDEGAPCDFVTWVLKIWTDRGW